MTDTPNTPKPPAPSSVQRSITPSKRLRFRAALATINVDEIHLMTSPRITPEIGRITAAIRAAGTGDLNLPADPYYYLAASDSPEARALMSIRDSARAHVRRMLPIEAFCISAKVSPLRILEIITATAVRLGAQASTIIAAVTHPKVVEKTVEMALTDEGVEDRTILHKATGFLPSPKGSQTTIHVAANANAAAHHQTAVVSAPPPEHTIKTLNDRFNQRSNLIAEPTLKELPAPAPPDRILEQINPPIPAREPELVDIRDPSESEEDL